MTILNYALLWTDLVLTRLKEMGIRKILGANILMIIKQNLTESFLFVVIALPFSMGFSFIFIKVINDYLGKSLSINYLNNITFTILFIFMTLIIGISSTIFNSVLFTKLRPITFFTSFKILGFKKTFFRKCLIIIQLFIFIFLISSSIVIYKQMLFIQKSDYGYNTDSMIAISCLGTNAVNKYQLYKNEIIKNKNINLVTATSDILPTVIEPKIQVAKPNAPHEFILFKEIEVDHNFLELMELQLNKGRTFSRKASINEKEVIINETAVQALGIENPVGTILHDNQTIIGVMKDFHVYSLHRPIPPILLTKINSQAFEILVKVKKGNIQNTIKFLEKKWKELNPEDQFRYFFADQQLEEIHRKEYKFSHLIQHLTLIAIFIACLGLLSHSLFVAERRSREAVIRRICGASVYHIIWLLIRDLLLLILIAAVLSFPVMQYFMGKWLQNYIYHIRIGIDIFVFVIFISVIVTLIITCYSYFRTSIKNPIDVLRYE